ncbi:unnamed protein product [Prunus armeniaca]
MLFHRYRELHCLHPLAALVSSCLEILNKFESYETYHIYREKNTDNFANWSHNLDSGPVYASPGWLGSMLADELLGLSKHRMISVA